MTGPPAWLVRLALLAYPQAFRRRFGGELADGLASAWLTPAGAAPVAHRLRLLTTTVAHGIAERAAALTRLLAWRAMRLDPVRALND